MVAFFCYSGSDLVSFNDLRSAKGNEFFIIAAQRGSESLPKVTSSHSPVFKDSAKNAVPAKCCCLVKKEANMHATSICTFAPAERWPGGD